MNIEEALIRLFKSDSVLTTYTSNRVYFTNAPEDANYPLMVIQKRSAIREQAFIKNPGIVDARFQFTAYTTDYPTLKTIINRINTSGVLLDFTGILSTSSTPIVDYTEFLDETEINIDPVLELYGEAVDWRLKYHE